MKKRKKKVKKIIIPVNTDILIMVSILVLIFVMFFSSEYISKTRETTTTSTITTTSIPSPTTTIPKIQTCSNFTWEIDDMKEFGLRGDYKIVLVNFTAQYIGPEEQDYYTGSHQFKILDDGGRYYNPQETYYRCDYANTFKIGIVRPEKEMSGCLEFRILDINEPTKLVFYDYIVHTMCEIDLSS